MKPLKLFIVFIVLFFYTQNAFSQGYADYVLESGKHWQHVQDGRGTHWYGWEDQDGDWHWDLYPGGTWPPPDDWGNEYGDNEEWGDNWWENEDDDWSDWWDDRDDQDWWDHWWDDPWDLWDWSTQETAGGVDIVFCPSLHTRTEKAPNRTRFILGIGEEFEVRIQNRCGANVQWSIAGSGLHILNSTNDFCKLQALWAPGVYQVKAKLTSIDPLCSACNKDLQIWYNVIKPNDIHFDITSTNPQCGASSTDHLNYVIHHYGYPSGGMQSDNYLLPESVNFYNVAVREGVAPAVFDAGAYWMPGDFFIDHPANGYVLCNDKVYPGKGTKVSAPDFIWSTFDCKNTRPPINPGSVSYTIPMYYQDAVTGDDKFMFNVVQKGDNIGGSNNPDFVISKKNASRTVKLLDPDFCPIIAANTCL